MSRRVLLLNKGESLINIVAWQEAVCLLVKGAATAPYGYDHFYKIPISLHSAEKMKESGDFEVEIEEIDGKPQGYFLLPTAIVLVQYVNIPYRRACVNKKNVLKRDHYKCGYCEKELSESTGTIDHIIPTSRWEEFKRKGKVKGKHSNNWKNVIASCRPCNCKKDDKTPEEAGMKLKRKAFVPSREYLVLYGIDLETAQTWDRWIMCSDDLM